MEKVLIKVVKWDQVGGSDVYVARVPVAGDHIKMKGRYFYVEKVELTAFEPRTAGADGEMDMSPPCRTPEYAATVQVAER